MSLLTTKHRCTAVQNQAQELLDAPYLSDTESEDLPATTTLRNCRVEKFVRTPPRRRGHKAADRLTTDPQATTAKHRDMLSAAGSESDMQRTPLENLSPSTHLVHGVARFPLSRSVAAPATFRGDREGEWSHVPYGNFPIYVDGVLQVSERLPNDSRSLEDKENVSLCQSSDIHNPLRLLDPFADFLVLGPITSLEDRREGI